jgi:hypothetical protein
MRRYADWLHTGVEPPITRDQFFITYRLHPRTAVSWTALSPGDRAALTHWIPMGAASNYMTGDFQRLATHDIMDDSVQVAVRLVARSTVTVRAGTSTVTQTLDPGEHIVVLPGARTDMAMIGMSAIARRTFTPEQFGRPHVTVTRSGTAILDVDAELPITQFIVPGGYNYYAVELTR